jgi:uncharacterized damage-inducible protein DinB
MSAGEGEPFATLVEHLRWADARALDSLRGVIHRDAEALSLYAHILGAEHVWLARIAGRAPEHPVWPTLDVDECAALAEANADELAALVRSADAAALSREVEYTNSAGDSFRSSVRDMLVQVMLHGAYHRGQVAARVRTAGGEPQATDYIAFTRGAPAAKRNDAAR